MNDQVVKLVDALVSNTSLERGAGSSPALATHLELWYFTSSIKISETVLSLASRMGNCVIVQVESMPHREVTCWRIIEFSAGWGQLGFGGWIINRPRVQGETQPGK